MRPDQNELWERYEDAMFTLLMDEVAHQEGQEQLEWKKQLNDDPIRLLYRSSYCLAEFIHEKS